MSASAQTLATIRPPRNADLRHLPGHAGWPVVGHTLEFLADPLAYSRRIHARYGPVSRSHAMFEPQVNLMSADANELVLLDRNRIFSAKLGWEPVLGRLFPRGLMLRDGDDHRYHRRLMQPAFRKEALALYLERMNPGIAQAVQAWGRAGGLRLYPALKHLTLKLAAEVFLGLSLQQEIDQVSGDFAAVVEASLAIVRVPVVGRLYARGLRSRAALARFLRERLPARRGGTGEDLFSQMCRAQDERGERYDGEEIVDHLIFLMMAAHDTTTSALTTIAYALARYPQWQEQLRQEMQGLGERPLAYEDLERLERTGWVLREALRLYPPLTSVTRRAMQEFEIHGHRIPAHTKVNLFPVLTQRQPQWWSEPDRFDPERFSPQRAEHKRHAFAWAPFGGGAHMCLGLHFAEMQVKAVLHALLRRCRLTVPAGYEMPYQLAPIARPRDGLPIRIEPL
ncbi:MAG: cytochrome P450 [Nevskia sp.]|nr:cytochrome P450 [Nevskia sp.]